MTRHRFRESIKSFFGYHVDPEKDEQLKGSKIEIEEKVATILKLIKDEEAEDNDGVPITSSKKEPLVRLIEDFHKHYQNLYAHYDHLTGELRKKANGKRDKDESSSSSSDSDSDSSTKNGGSKNGHLEREFQAISEGLKQELEAANLEIADLKRKLTDTSEERDALNSNYLASLSKVQEAEEIITNLKLESERSENEKSKYVVENEELRHKLDTAAKMEAELNQRLEDLHRENSNLIQEKEAAVKRTEDGEKFTEDLRREVGLLKEENITLKQKLDSVKGEVSGMQQQLEASERRVLKVSQSFNATVEENKSLNSKLSEVSDEIQLALGTIQQLKAEISQSKVELGDKERELVTLKELHEVHGNQSSAKIKELEAQVTSLELKLEQLQTTNRDMELQIENKASEAKQLGEVNIGLQSQISEVEMMSKQREEELLNLKKKFEDNEKESLSRVENLTVQINNLVTDMEPLRTQKAQLEEHIAVKGDEASTQIKTLMDQINTLQQELESLHSQKAELEVQLESKAQAISDHVIEIEKVKEEIVSKTEDHQRVLQENEGLLAQTKELELEVNSLRNQKGELEEDLRTKIEENGQLREENTGLQSQISKLEVISETRQEELLSLTKKFEDNEKESLSRVENLTLQIKNMVADMESLHTQKAQLREEKVGLQGQIIELEKTLAEKGLEFNALQEKQAGLENETSSQLTALVAEVNDLQRELDSLQARRNELELQLEREKQESSERLAEFENEKSELESQISNQQRMLEDQGEAYKKLAEEYKEVEGLYQECKANLEIAERKLEEMSEEFRSNIDSKNQMAADLKQMVEDLQRDLQAKEDGFNKLSDEYKQHETSFQECKATIEITERKMQEMAGEHNTNIQSKDEIVAELEQTIEDLKRDIETKGDEISSLVEKVRNIEVKLRLSNQKLRVTEQLLTENEESYRKAEAKYQEEQRLLEEKISTLSGIVTANNEAYCRMINDISENVNSTLIGFEAVIQKFEEGCRNYTHCIEETSKVLTVAKHWIEETKSERKRLTNEATTMIEQLKDLKERESTLQEQVEKLRIKANKEEGGKENLLKTVNQLEKKVEHLETVMKEKDEGIVGLGEEKREAIRQLCLWSDYHRSRCDDLKEIISKTVRIQRAV